MPTKTQATAPVRSLDQRMEALARANDIRVRRAQLKKDLKNGTVQIEAILEQTATDLGATGRDNEYGYGLINARAALRGMGLAK